MHRHCDSLSRVERSAILLLHCPHQMAIMFHTDTNHFVGTSVAGNVTGYSDLGVSFGRHVI